MVEAVLREVADRQPARLDDVAAVRLVQAGQHLQKRRFSGAVRAAEADPLALFMLPAARVQKYAIAEPLAERRELDHGPGRFVRGKRSILARAYSPRAFAAA